MKFEDIISKMLEIHKTKNNDYSREGEFGNFRESERVGISPALGAFIRLQDKYTRVCNLISGKEQMVKDEKLEDTLLDLANYSVIVLCLLDEENINKSADICSICRRNYVHPDTRVDTLGRYWCTECQDKLDNMKLGKDC